MESGERRRRSGVKTHKKAGGKQVKALAAEEEARRREVVKEKLMKKLELEKRALKIVERLLEDSVSEDFLTDCAKYISPLHYKDAIEERSIAKVCGYPICSNTLGKIPNQKYKISTKTNKVYDITERKCFCSNFCYKASKEFELQISNTPLWVRQHESLPEIKLIKKGDRGSSGEEVLLSERRVEERDIEDPLATLSENPDGSLRQNLSDNERSDDEQEQEFVSSVVSQQGPRVHWGNLPKRTDEESEDEQRTMQRTIQESPSCETGVEMDAGKQRLSLNTESKRELVSEEERSLEEATCELHKCTLSETVSQTDRCPDSSHTPVNNTSSTLTDSNPNSDVTELTSLNITLVGMSKRGAAGLRVLLKNHAAGDGSGSIGMNLLKRLEATLKDWRTDATVTFLCGSGDSLSSPSSDAREEEEEELDEDDLDDEESAEDTKIVSKLPERPSAVAPDFDRLRKEAQQMELRVREFYKGPCILPEEAEEQPAQNMMVHDQSSKDPVLPLVHCHSQHLIQKRITVEKLTSCLGNIVGPLRLTISDISTDLNNLVRTFRFTNKNIIHKTPEWMLIGIVLLHVLSEVSPLVQEALETPGSEEYLNTLMEELGLRVQDLLTLIRVFKTTSH
ncbi:putative RNA polymerase II subunit B1 CTD phosphatase rpap2 [Antennarius striatus]|uniref:putative RNA polymerase II subunit B1 CTD phosphatase rpap2 n=1 Tax=Antennarius striatus TaxID=241820 RepID=UPI0035B064B7